MKYSYNWLKELKMPVVIGETIIDFPTPSNPTPDDTLVMTKQLIEKYKDDPLVQVAVAPHSIYTVGKENLIKASKLAKEYNCLIHIHAAETEWEVAQCQKDHGLTPIQYLDQLGLLTEKTILAHCVWLRNEDIDILARRKTSVSHCPLSNLKLGSGIAPITKMLEKGVNVSLGTDGAASSNRLDIWEAGKFAALIHKGINTDPTHIPAKQAFEMMSINGMKALNLTNINEKSLPEYEKILKEIENYSDLYHLQISDFSFSN